MQRKRRSRLFHPPAPPTAAVEKDAVPTAQNNPSAPLFFLCGLCVNPKIRRWRVTRCYPAWLMFDAANWGFSDVSP